MKRISASLEMPAQVEEVWALACDVSRYAEWVDPTDRVLEADPEPLGVGYAYREYGGIPPFKGESDWRVAEFEPPRRQRHIGDDGLTTVDLLIELESRGEAPSLTMTIELRPRWFIAPVNAVLWPLIMRARTQEALRKTMEAVLPAVESGRVPNPHGTGA